MIVGYPYEGIECVSVYDSNGDKVPLQIVTDNDDKDSYKDWYEDI